MTWVRPMTETEWLTDPKGRQLLHIEPHASDRKLRLIAAALVRHLQPKPEHADAKRCDDFIESVADEPRPWEELEMILHARPGDWRFAHILPTQAHDRVAMALRKLVALYRYDPVEYPVRAIHEIIGNPFRPVSFLPEWRTDTAVTLARQMYEARDFSAMAILADALQDAGCDNDDILNHCRQPGEHVRGCWVCDLVLGKE
jgi:hypothetical protein